MYKNLKGVHLVAICCAFLSIGLLQWPLEPVNAQEFESQRQKTEEIPLQETPLSSIESTFSDYSDFGSKAIASNVQRITARSGHICSPTEIDYVLTTQPNGQANGLFELKLIRPAGSGSIVIDQPIYRTGLQIAEVVDLNGDGYDEIVVINAIEATLTSPPLRTGIFIYGFNPTTNRLEIKNTVNIASPVLGRNATRNFEVKLDYVKIYQRADGKRNIVFVPHAFDTGTTGSFYFFISNGSSPQTLSFSVITQTPNPCTSGGCDVIDFPNITVGNVNSNYPGKEVVILTKSRLFLFKEDGSKIVYKQFVDPQTNNVTSYDASRDMIDGVTGPQGRRYGQAKLAPLTGGSTLTGLIVVADSLPNGSGGTANFPYVVLQSFMLSNITAQDGYLAPFKSKVINVPGRGPVTFGPPVNRITNLDVESRTEVVVTKYTSNPAIEVYKLTVGGWVQIGQVINGKCLDVVKLSDPTSVNFPPEVIVKEGQDIKFYQWNATTNTFQLLNSIFVGQDRPEPAVMDTLKSFSLSGKYELYGSSSGATKLVLTKSDHISSAQPQAIGIPPQPWIMIEGTQTGSCGTLQSFNRNNGFQTSLNTILLGRFLFCSTLEDPNNPRFVFNTFNSTCTTSEGVVSIYRQEGPNLVLAQ